MTAQERERAAARFRQAAALLPEGFRRPLAALPPGAPAEIEELRLRAGRAGWPGQAGPLGGGSVNWTEGAERFL